jgi:hypothetical protein
VSRATSSTFSSPEISRNRRQTFPDGIEFTG